MSNFIFRSKRMKHVRGLLRVAGYLAATSLVFCAYSVKVARADARNRTLEIGREMLGFAQARNHDVTPITMNGQSIYLSSSITDDAPDTVLDRYESACKADPGQPALGWRDAEAKHGKPIDGAPESASGAIRVEGVGEGTVVCFVRGENTKTSIEEAFQSFTRTGELGALGKLRYAYAKKSGTSGRTLVLTAWTDDKFNLGEMLPDGEKDAPGTDFPEIPRVPHSFRAFSASADGLPYGVNVYKSTDAPATTLAFYDTEMVKAGWIGYKPKATQAEDGVEGRNYLKSGMVLTVSASVEPEGNFVALGLAGVAGDSNAPAVSR